ncbi:MAG: glycosyltransferase [Planctomycetota bacterium]
MTFANTPPVTWLIPVLNGMPYVRETLESIASQTYPNARLLVWDNGSTDGTVDELRKWVPSRIPGQVVVDRPMSYPNALRALVECADTELLARIDADDIAEPTRLERQVETMLADPDLAVLGTFGQRIDPDGNPLPGGKQHATTDAEVRWRLRFAASLAHPCAMMRRSAILSVGSYRDLRPYEDCELWARLAPRFRLYNLPDKLMRCRAHPNSVVATDKPDTSKVMRQIAFEHAATLYPSVDIATIRAVYDALFEPDRTVTLAELAGLRDMARAAAIGGGLDPNYFVNTRVYRAQRDQLRRRVLTRVPGVRAAWSIAGSAKRAVTGTQREAA